MAVQAFCSWRGAEEEEKEEEGEEKEVFLMCDSRWICVEM